MFGLGVPRLLLQLQLGAARAIKSPWLVHQQPKLYALVGQHPLLPLHTMPLLLDLLLLLLVRALPVRGVRQLLDSNSMLGVQLNQRFIWRVVHPNPNQHCVMYVDVCLLQEGNLWHLLVGLPVPRLAWQGEGRGQQQQQQLRGD